jgi:diguanylate cyclase (GGDEF)-like protein
MSPVDWSATQVALLAIAVVQGAFAVIWAIGASLVKNVRPALLYWAAWAGLSVITWITIAAQLESPPLAGVLVGVLGAICLQRGTRLFIARPMNTKTHVALIALVIAVALLPTPKHVKAITNFGVLGWLYFDIGRDVFRHGRQQLPRVAWLLALPVTLGGVGFGFRALTALVNPDSVATVMETNSALNVNGALSYIALVLMLHATLITLVVARLLSELRRLSRHDALTGLLNRRAMEEALRERMTLKRQRDAFVVMMLDLDHFKRINDQFGHPVGDAALQHVSRLLSSELGPDNSLARFGGEEFVVMMPQAGLRQGQPLAERLKDLLSANPLAHPSATVSLSVSIGVAEWLGEAEDISHLLSRADAALFQAKVQGRNRVVTAVPDIESATALSRY